MDAQSRVAAFVETNDVAAPPTYRLLDAVAEVGEVAAAMCTSTGYGEDPETVAVPEDELGDALFALLALCEALDVDADAALETALAKYDDRIEDRGGPGSGD